MLSVKNVSYKYDDQVQLHFKDFQLNENSQLLILGGSGKGKTTLLHLIAGLRSLQYGEILLNGISYSQLNGASLDQFRAKNIGLVFQQPHLISSLSILENLMLSQKLTGQSANKEKALSLLEAVNLSNKVKSKPSELSSGQAQRVSLIRAMINQPQIILADEPTSSLDDDNANDVMDLLINNAASNGSILLVTTHDQRVKERIKNHYLL